MVASMYEGMVDVNEVAMMMGRSVSWVWHQLTIEGNDFPQPAWRRKRDTKWWRKDIVDCIERRRQALLAGSGVDEPAVLMEAAG